MMGDPMRLNRNSFASLESTTRVVEYSDAHCATAQKETKQKNRNKYFHGGPSSVSKTRLIMLAFLVLSYCGVCSAQTTQVTGTIVDPANLAYAGATLKSQLVVNGAGVTGQPTVTVNNAGQCASGGFGSAPCQVPFHGTHGPITLDSTGSFNIALEDNSLVTPGGTQWLFTVTISPGIPPPAGNGPQSCFATVTISGASQSITSSFSCPLLAKPITPGAAGSPGQTITNNGGVLAGTPCQTLPNNAVGPVNVNCDWHPKGPNPFVDITSFGARACNPNITPCATGLTATCTASSPVVTISSASTFQNGDGVALYGCGPQNSLTTPAAPTVTNVLANGGTGTGAVATSSAGATTKCYEVAARDVMGGLTAVSPETCTTTGQATLGAVTVSLASATRSGTTITFTTSSAHAFLVGCSTCGEVFITGNSDATFNGWFLVNSAANNTTFTVKNLTNSTANGGTTSSGSVGTATFYPANHIVWTQVTNAWIYYIYCGASGAETRCGESNAQGTNIDLEWDDFANIQTNWSFPLFVPTSPPATPTSDNLSTTIVSGGGTTTLTLANAPGTSVSGVTIRLDAAPAILAASAFSGGTFSIPIDPNGNSFEVNTFVDLRNTAVSVQQSATLIANDTIAVSNASWRNGYNSLFNAVSVFDSQQASFVVQNGARPGLYIKNAGGQGPDVRGVSFSGCSATNGCQLVLVEGGFGMIYDTDTFNTGTTVNDLMGIGLYLRGSSGQSAASVVMDKMYFASGNTADGTSHNATFVCNLCGDVIIRSAYAIHRGWLFSSPSAGGSLTTNTVHINGGGTPLVTTFTNAASPGPVSVIFGNGAILMDTISQPCLAGFAGTTSIFGVGCMPSGGISTITGNVNAVIGGPLQGVNSLVGGSLTPGLNSAGVQMVWSRNDGPISASAANGAIFVDGPTPLAPTAAVSAGGSLPTSTTFTGIAVPVWTGTLEGNPSPKSNIVTTSTGNQTVTITGTALNPAPKCYNIYVSENNGGFGAIASSLCVPTPSFTFTNIPFFSQTLGPIIQSGPTTMLPSGMVTPALTLAGVNVQKTMLTTTYTNATTTPSNIPSLSFAAAVSTSYSLTCHLYYQASAGTAGLDITVTGPASPTNVFYSYDEDSTSTSLQNSVASAFGTKLTGNAAVTATTNLHATVTLGLINGSNVGTVQVQGSATGAGTVTVQPGSFCQVF